MRQPTRVNLLALTALFTIMGLVTLLGLIFVSQSLLTPPPLPTLLQWTPPATSTPPTVFPTLPPAWTATPTPTPTDTPNYALTPSPTPLIFGGVTLAPEWNGSPIPGREAQVAQDADYLRIRSFPGTQGEIIGSLRALTPLDLVGRSADNEWIEVVSADQPRGWVMAQYLNIFINLLDVPITAQASLNYTPTNSPYEGQVAEDGQGLRLRQIPGTAGGVIAFLDVGTLLDIVGRTADNIWLQVVTPDNIQGWVMTQFVDVTISVDSLPVTGQPLDAPTSSGGTSVPIVYVSPTPLPTRTPSPTITPSPTRTPTPTPTPSPTVTPSPTLPPPPDTSTVILNITSHAREIFLDGQTKGNRRDVFSKVGDSITTYWQYLVTIGTGDYNLRSYGYLEETVAFFRATRAYNGNSFVNTSFAAKAGWSSFSVLAPSAANTSVCHTNESPLVCEYRLTRPAVALIMIGTNDVLGTSNDAYRANLQRIARDSVQMGIIPVFSTIPPYADPMRDARVNDFNAIIWQVAQEYQVPVWHYWAVMQALPNRGLGPDGVHPSFAPDPDDFTPENLQYGFAARNLLALQMLEALRTQVLYP